MIQDVKELVARYSSVDEPVPYKGLSIYPIYVKNYYDFGISYDVLLIDKNAIPDIEVIQMSYLDFLFKKLMVDETKIDEKSNVTVGMIYVSKLTTLLTNCFHVDGSEIKVRMQDNHIILTIKDVDINSMEFEDIKRIILYQNIYDYSDEYVDPDVKKAIDEYYRIKNKGIKMPDLETKMAALTAMIGLTKKNMLDMTYREFEYVFHIATQKQDYEINKTAEMSGMVKFEKPIEHWIYQQKKDRYADAFTNFDEFKKKTTI